MEFTNSDVERKIDLIKVQRFMFTVNAWKDCVSPLATTARGFC